MILGLKKKKALDLPLTSALQGPSNPSQCQSSVPSPAGGRGQGKEPDRPPSELRAGGDEASGEGVGAGAPSSHLSPEAPISDNRRRQDHRQEEDQVCGKWKSSLSRSLLTGRSTFFSNLDNKNNEKPSIWKEFS